MKGPKPKPKGKSTQPPRRPVNKRVEFREGHAVDPNSGSIMIRGMQVPGANTPEGRAEASVKRLEFPENPAPRRKTPPAPPPAPPPARSRSRRMRMHGPGSVEDSLSLMGAGDRAKKKKRG